VLDICLVPEMRGNGIGSWLLENVVEQAARLAAPVTLHVAVGNPARRLYERIGFRVVTQDPLNLFMEHAAGRNERRQKSSVGVASADQLSNPPTI
jgi:ribosomal protein S18 acetylase RimI-like enzyme